MARERLNDKLLRLTQENAALKAEIAALKEEKKEWQSKENLLSVRDSENVCFEKYCQMYKRASRLECALRMYHGFATYHFWWLNRDHDLGLDMNLCHFGWDDDRELINELFPQKEREEEEAEWEAQWQFLHMHKVRCSSDPLSSDLDDIWKAFKTVSSGSK